MGDETPEFAFPYPLGTDAVRDGDNYMRGLAEAVEGLFSVTNSAVAIKPISANDFATIGWIAIPGSLVTLTLPESAVIYLRAMTDFSDFGTVGFIATKIQITPEVPVGGAVDYPTSTDTTFESSGPTSINCTSPLLQFLAAGVYSLRVMCTTLNEGVTFDVGNTMWMIQAFGTVPELA